MRERPKPGARVRYSDAFRAEVGLGPDDRNEWTVVECECSLCRSGLFVASDEEFGPGGIAVRHLEVAGLEPVRTARSRSADAAPRT